MNLDHMVAEALGTVHNLIEDRAAEAQAEIRLSTPGGWAQVEILRTQLRTILDNHVDNHVDKNGNVMSPAGLARSIQELCR